ncbi:type I polyketide synthase [Frankia sp. AgKG'84/4]
MEGENLMYRVAQTTEAPTSAAPPAPAEPVAVIGLGCRFPGGADGPEAFWNLLLDGRDGIGEPPVERWSGYADLGPDHAAAVRRAAVPGGFLADISGFDAAFFGLTPREAELMDPQQRLLLELSWEALEHAGVAPRDLAGSDTGVFVGIGSDDYGRRMLEDLPAIEAWTGIGSALCAAANRISYALDLRGPSLAVDTACSASLVATHLACQSLRTGESSLALVGGVNLIISPGLTLTLEAAGATAADGRCKPFDAAADGYGRGEGGGILVLKLLSAAARDGDRVLAVIRGSAVHQDGRTGGIMAPNGDAQRELLARACSSARVAPDSVDYVETHGTGTSLGDPLEAGALAAVYGAGRSADRPCLIGSVKPNIGHLEAGAGVASLIKTTLVLAHDEIPPSLNFRTGNPAIDWPASGLRVVTERTVWPDNGQVRRAGVSGFGYGGTIGHVLLEEAPAPAPATETAASAGPDRFAPGRDDAATRSPGAGLFPLSAASEPALRAYAGRLADWLTEPGGTAPAASLEAVGHTLGLRRSHLEHRATMVATDRDDLVDGLRHVAAGTPSRQTVTATVAAGRGAGLVWVFSGHGSQWVGMGRELLVTEPAFTAVLAELEPVFAAEAGFSPRKVLEDGELHRIDHIQTMIFVMQVGLAAVWRSYGVTPDAVIGHSVGEIAAAVACGALTLSDGALLSCRRSRLLRRVAGAGAMAMAPLPFDEAQQRLAGRTDLVAAISASPSSSVLSGSPAALDALAEQWAAEDIQLRRVASDVAFHSPQMDELVDELAAAAANLMSRAPRIPMYRTALADPRANAPLDAAYWAGNLRNPVLLSAAVEAATQDGFRAFLEISAHPVVAHSVSETLAELGTDRVFVGSSLRRDQPEGHSMLAALGAAHSHGITVDWRRLAPAGDLVTLPPVAWQRQSHWHRGTATEQGQGLRHDPDSHTLLGSEIPIAGRSPHLWRTLLDDSSRPYPGHHTIEGTEVVPAAVVLTTFLAAGGHTALDDVELRLPLIVGPRREVQVLRDETGLRLASRAPDGDWLAHATALPTDGEPVQTRRARGLRPADPGEVRSQLASVGVPSMAFDWTVAELLRGVHVLRARVEIGPSTTWAAVLDAALSVAPAVFAGPPALRMVAGLSRVRLAGPPPSTVDVQVINHDDLLDVLVLDATGAVVGQLGGLRYGVATGRPAARPPALVHELVWRPLDLPAPPDGAAHRDIVLVGAGELDGAGGPDRADGLNRADGLAAALRAAGARCRTVRDPTDLTDLTDPGAPPTDVLVMAPPAEPGESVPVAAGRAAWLLLAAARQLAESRTARLWALTTGVRESEGEAQLTQSTQWGLGRVLAGEHNGLWGGIVDLPAGDLAEAGGTPLLDVLRAGWDEDVVAVRGTDITRARLRPVAARPEEPGGLRPPLACRADASYLVTGGLGQLGLAVAHWLTERGARRLVLAGRHGLPPRREWDDPTDPETRRRIDAVRALEGLGVTVRVVALDVADEAATARALSECTDLPPISGIVHAAGVLDNRMALDVDESSLRTVLRPKVNGAWNLHRLFPPGTVDFFVLFASCGQLLRLPGQASYGAANAFLDALAAHRGDTTSFDWTSWRGQGMAANKAVDRALRAIGVTDISPAEAFAAWDFASRRGPGQFVILNRAPVDDGRPAGAGTDDIPLLAELDVPPGGTTRGAGGAGAENTPQTPDPLAGLLPDELRRRMVEVVGADVAGEMRLAATALDVDRSLVEQGLDSVMTIVLRRRLEKRFGRRLPSTLLWHHPSVAAIADHLIDQLAAPPGP